MACYQLYQCHEWGVPRIMEDGSRAKADEFDDAFRGHDEALKAEVARSETYL